MDQKKKLKEGKGEGILYQGKKSVSRKEGASGITLVALVVTIVVLLILVGITLIYALGEDSIFKEAQDAKDQTQARIEQEKEDMGNLVNLIKENKPKDPPKEEPIDTVTSYVGYYADMEGDGVVDGIIYADLAKGKTATGNWENDNGAYEISAVTTGLKEYYVSNESYTGNFYAEEKPVITPVNGSTGKERFYIMALEDVKDEAHSDAFEWYNAAWNSETHTGNMDDWETVTSVIFGSGKSNTNAMIAKWDSNGYGAKNADSEYLDIWGAIKEKVNQGWYVPSKEEWSAFGQELGITKENYKYYNLKVYYWSSSQHSKNYAWRADYAQGFMDYGSLAFPRCVRLGATF